MKLHRLLLTMLTVLLAGCLYKAFEPVIVWNFGWKPLPDATTRAASDTIEHEDVKQEIAAARLLLIKAQQQTGAPAMSVAIGQHNQVLWAEAIGLRDVEQNLPANTDTQFRLGSTSKAVTSVAIGVLLNDGILDLDAPIQEYLGDFPQKQAAITTRMVMSHSAGFRNYGWCFCFPVWEQWQNESFSTSREALSIFSDDELLFKPGSQFSYTSYGYNISGAVIESISRKAFPDYLHQHVLVPLNMNRTDVEVAENVDGNRAVFYEVKNGQFKKSFPVDNSNKWPSGGLISTPHDLVLMGNALLNNTFVPEPISNALFTVQTLEDGQTNPQNYALGWRNSANASVLNDTRKTVIIHHGGLATGSSSVYMLLPEFDLTVSLMMNKGTDDYSEILTHAKAIADVFIARSLR